MSPDPAYLLAKFLMGGIVLLLLFRAALFQVGVRTPASIFSGRSTAAAWFLFLAVAGVFVGGFLAPIPAIWLYLVGAVGALLGAVFEVLARHRAARSQGSAALGGQRGI
jgi:peptidoglycan/LPS O-acetylase OafA/YrhL